MPTTEQVIVEFVPDFTQLDNAFQKLSSSGAVDKATAQAFTETNKAIQQESASITELKKQYDDLKNSVSKMSEGAQKAFEEGIMDALNEAGVSMDEFLNALKNGVPKAKGATNELQRELKKLTIEIAKAKAAGSPIDPKTIERAGQLKDAIADARAEIKNAASDTRNVDNIVGSIGALAGGFQAAQGAAALFGGESEDVQKTLVQLNATMAVAQGVQQVLNALQKEGALVKLADVIAAKAMTTAQTIWNAVVGTSTGLLRGLKVAFAATGIGLFIVLIYELVSAMGDANDTLEDANNLIDSQNSLLELNNATIKRNTDLELARAKAVGKAESELIKIRGRSLVAQINAIDEQNKALAKERDSMDNTSEGWFKLNEQIEKNNDTRKELLNQAQVLEIDLGAQVAEENEKRRQKAIKDAHDARIQELKDNIARIETQLLDENLFATKRLDLEKQLVDAKNQLQIESEKKTQAELTLIATQGAHDRMEIQKKFSSQMIVESTGATEKINATGKAIKEASKTDADSLVSTAMKSFERLSALFNARRDQAKKDKEKEIADAKDAAERRKQSLIDTLNAVSTLASFFSDFQKQQDQAAIDRINRERDHVDELLQAGAITEKDAKQRMIRLDQEEKRIKREQARRDKEIALFNAVINGAAAIAKAVENPVQLAIAIAVVAAQIALIASRPLPKFATGKKGTFKGLGIVGEAGSELVQQDGRLMLATKPAMVYLNPSDKVYSHAETKRIMQNIDSSLYKYSAKSDAGFDYDRLGESIARNQKNVAINIDRDFISESVANGLSYRKYFDKRYSSK